MAKNIANRTLDRSRSFGQIVGAMGTDARYEQDGLYFSSIGRICKSDRMLPAKDERVEYYAQDGQEPSPAAAPVSRDTMITTVVEGREVRISVGELAAQAGIGVAAEEEEDEEPDDGDPAQGFSIAEADMEGALAITVLPWPDLRSAAAQLKVPGKNKDGILDGFKSLNISHVKRA